MVSSTPRPHFTPEKDPVPILQEAGWAPGPFWTGRKSRPLRDLIPDRPARSQSLYQLSYPAHFLSNINRGLFITETECVYFAVRTKCRLILYFRRLIFRAGKAFGNGRREGCDAVYRGRGSQFSSSSSAVQLLMNFGLLSYFVPLLPLLRSLFPVLHSHLFQIISHVVRPS